METVRLLLLAAAFVASVAGLRVEPMGRQYGAYVLTPENFEAHMGMVRNTPLYCLVAVDLCSVNTYMARAWRLRLTYCLRVQCHEGVHPKGHLVPGLKDHCLWLVLVHMVSAQPIALMFDGQTHADDPRLINGRATRSRSGCLRKRCTNSTAMA